METSKTKTKAGRPSRKSAANPGTTRKVRSAEMKQVPGEEEIRIKAAEIYNERIASGEEGNAEADWLKAEKLLRG